MTGNSRFAVSVHILAYLAFRQGAAVPGLGLAEGRNAGVAPGAALDVVDHREGSLETGARAGGRRARGSGGAGYPFQGASGHGGDPFGEAVTVAGGDSRGKGIPGVW